MDSITYVGGAGGVAEYIFQLHVMDSRFTEPDELLGPLDIFQLHVMDSILPPARTIYSPPAFNSM